MTSKILKNIFLSLVIVFQLSCTHAVCTEVARPGWMSDCEWMNLKADQRVSAWRVELESHVQGYLVTKHFRLGPGAEGQMRFAIEKAARDIDQTPENQKMAKVEEAKRNFTKFIDEMINSSYSIPGYADRNFRAIGEETFLAALKKLCPIWPFCKE